jgi:hypothetical protein
MGADPDQTDPGLAEATRALLDALLLPLPGVVAGTLFGVPAYSVRRKVFACLYGGAVAVKVPESLARSLAGQSQIAPFQPMGRPRMREWVEIRRATPEAYRQDAQTLRAAYDHVAGLTGG